MVVPALVAVFIQLFLRKRNAEINSWFMLIGGLLASLVYPGDYLPIDIAVGPS
jgi:dolichol kinase